MATSATHLPTPENDNLTSTTKFKLKAKKPTEVLFKRYPELRPKPDPIAKSLPLKHAKPVRSRLVSLRNPYSGCLISLCRTRKCRLLTHHRGNFTKSSDKQDAITKELTATYSDLRLGEIPDLKLDAFPRLPGDLLEIGEARRLFHTFFSYDYPRQQALLFPPSTLSATKQLNRVMRQDALDKALSSAVYCLTYIASAHLHEQNRMDDLSPNKVSGVLRGKLLQLLREKLDNFTAAESENIILVILTIVQFDMALIQRTAFDGHRNALQLLINKRGGIHNLQYATQYVLVLDRILAMYTGKPPLYAERIDRKFLRPPKVEPRYGFGFDVNNKQLELDPKVLVFCFDVCRAIEIVEHENWNFEPDRALESFDPSQIQYLYFLKYHIHNTFAHLQADPLLNPEKSKPVLFAANVVAYLILQINFLPAITLLLVKRLRSSLQAQKLPEDWFGYGDILCWIMCTLLTNPGYWDGTVWAQECLTRLVNEKYGYNEWPNSWVHDQLENVKSFVWSSRLDRGLKVALHQLEQSRFASSDQMKTEPRTENHSRKGNTKGLSMYRQDVCP